MSAPTNSPPPHPIVFFDGVCGLCNHFVDFLVRHDRNRRLRYAPLQGDTARAVLPQALLSARVPDSVVLLDNGVTLTRSRAVLRIFSHLGGLWSCLLILRLVPQPILDWAYDGVARHRYAWFGHRDVCRLPTMDEKPLFFD